MSLARSALVGSQRGGNSLDESQQDILVCFLLAALLAIAESLERMEKHREARYEKGER